MGLVRPAAIRRPSLRRRLPRSRVAWHRRIRQDPAAVRHWLLVAVLAWGLATVVGRAQDQADTARSQWGRTTSVWVAQRPLRAGDPFAGAVRAERWPRAQAPAAALAAVPAGARASGPVDAGAALTTGLIEPAGPGRRTIAVPLAEAHLPVRAGDRVDVWATADPAAVADGEPATRRVAADARIATASARSVVLEVDPAQVAAVAEAGSTATITLVGR